MQQVVVSEPISQRVKGGKEKNGSVDAVGNYSESGKRHSISSYGLRPPNALS